jgi:hypothetical protein
MTVRISQIRSRFRPSGCCRHMSLRSKNSMVTARNKDCEDHQVGIGEQPLFCLFSSGFRGARDGAQVFAVRQTAKMLKADPGQSGDFFLSEDLLTRLDGDHFLSTIPTVCTTVQALSKTVAMIRTRLFVLQ